MAFQSAARQLCVVMFTSFVTARIETSGGPIFLSNSAHVSAEADLNTYNLIRSLSDTPLSVTCTIHPPHGAEIYQFILMRFRRNDSSKYQDVAKITSDNEIVKIGRSRVTGTLDPYKGGHLTATFADVTSREAGTYRCRVDTMKRTTLAAVVYTAFVNVDSIVPSLGLLSDHVRDFRKEVAEIKARTDASLQSIDAKLKLTIDNLNDVSAKTDGLQRKTGELSSKLTNHVSDEFSHRSWWITIQRRFQPFDLDFKRTLAEYKSGFGDVDGDGEMWLGLDKINTFITRGQEAKLLIEITQAKHQRVVMYGDFNLGDAATNYVMNLGSVIYTDTVLSAGDGMLADGCSVNGQAFSTGNSLKPGSNCIRDETGWWFQLCNCTTQLNAATPVWRNGNVDAVKIMMKTVLP